MDVPASRETPARTEELEALVRALEDENARLSEAQTDAVLLGVLADQVQRETGVDGVLRTGVERLSVLKDLPVALACVRDGDRLVARAAYVTAGEDEPHEVVLSPDPAVLAALDGGPVPLSGVEECAAARLGAGALPGGIVPHAVLLVPFASRALGRGAFVLADDRSEVRLVESAAVLARGAEFVVARLENVALVAEVERLTAALQARGAEAEGHDPVTLAATEAIPGRAAPPEPPRAALGRGETVLVVDDEPLVRRAVARALKARGYAVVEAGCGDDALAVLSARGPVDLLLTDVVMPGMRGPELVRAFEARCPGRPALLMSGYPEAGGGEAPQGSWLEKPISPEALARAVRDALDRAMGRVAG